MRMCVYTRAHVRTRVWGRRIDTLHKYVLVRKGRSKKEKTLRERERKRVRARAREGERERIMSARKSAQARTLERTRKREGGKGQ